MLTTIKKRISFKSIEKAEHNFEIKNIQVMNSMTDQCIQWKQKRWKHSAVLVASQWRMENSQHILFILFYFKLPAFWVLFASLYPCLHLGYYPCL